MRYTVEEKKNILSGLPANTKIDEYCKEIGIHPSTYYQWKRDFDNQTAETSFLDVTKLVNECNSSSIKLEISDISIHINNNYDENHLLNVIRTLKKL